MALVYTEEQLATLKELEEALQERMEARNKKRYLHSLSVASYAEKLAEIYGADPYLARVAGILHDWDKLLTKEELIDSLSVVDFDFGVEPMLILPLIHGVSASYHLQELYGDRFPKEVYSAIAKHTVAGTTMSDLDKIIYVADSIEPTRPDTASLVKLRAEVGAVDLDQLFFDTLKGAIIYVLETGRYLWPKTLDVYNAWAK